MTESAFVREVGLRDGLQMIATFMPTARKTEWIDRCCEAGFTELEVCSFVPTQYIAQFSDAEAVVSHTRDKPGLVAATLVPNLQGAKRALEAGAGKLVCIVSATESFSQANLRRSKSRSMEELQQIIQLREEVSVNRHKVPIQVGVSVAFGCPFEGSVADEAVCATAVAAARLGADEISLADTAGQGDPGQVRRVFGALRAELPQMKLAAHFHDTRGLGLANVLAALDVGVRSFDASTAGIGGCPNSPGATGNVATEDLVFMLEALGFDTGIDLQRLLEIRQFLCASLPGVAGHMGTVGVPKGFKYARQRSAGEGA